jgi:hypothetical protein
MRGLFSAVDPGDNFNPGKVVPAERITVEG